MVARVVLGDTSLTFRRHLANMLAIIAENRDAMRIERGSAVDKEITAARKFMIETQPQDGDKE